AMCATWRPIVLLASTASGAPAPSTRMKGTSIAGASRSATRTSSPRARSRSTTFRPTKPAPPVTRIIPLAVVPAKGDRSGSFLSEAEQPGPDGAGMALAALAGVHAHEELEHRAVERIRLFQVDRVAGPRDDDEAGGWDGALHEEP